MQNVGDWAAVSRIVKYKKQRGTKSDTHSSDYELRIRQKPHHFSLVIYHASLVMNIIHTKMPEK
jgi:hypothetical protein